MNRTAAHGLVTAVTAAAAAGLALVASSSAASAGAGGLDPTDPRLLPNPVESSDAGTSWSCRLTGADAQCAGELSYGWAAVPGPDDWCSQPLWSADGRWHRSQVRYYSVDPATGQLAEYKRLVHIETDDHLVASPDADPAVGLETRLLMTWRSEFGVPGDLDSRVTQKQGIDTWFKLPGGGVFTLDVGQKTTIGSDDFDLRGRWDFALGADPYAEFGKVCTALGL